MTRKTNKRKTNIKADRLKEPGVIENKLSQISTPKQSRRSQTRPASVNVSEKANGCSPALQRSKFLKILQKNGNICLFHSISMRMVFGGLVLADLYEAFADAKIPQHVIDKFSDIYAVDLLIRVIDDLTQKGMLVWEPCEDVRVYRKAYQKALNRYRIQHMYLFPTDACNFRCKYCFIEEECRLQKPSFMDTSTAEMTLTSFARLSHESGHASVVFYGGEPLLNRETTFYCLRRLRDMEADGTLSQVTRISVLTNGSLIDNEAIRVFKETMPNIGVSIDGPAPLHDAVRVDEHGRGTFSLAIAGYRRLQDAGINPGISCTLSSSSINYMDEIVDFIINDLKPRGMGFNLPLPLSNGNQPEQEFDHELGVKQLIRAFKRLREAGIYEDRMMRRIRPFKNQQIHCKDCMGVGGQIVVTPTGRVGPCQAYLGLNDEKFFPLNVRQLVLKGSKLSAEDIYSNPLFGEWCQRFPLNMHECADCIAISVCGGGCPYASDMKDGSIWEIDKRVCHQAKNILDWMVWETYEYAGELEQEKVGVNKKKQQNLTQESVGSKLDDIDAVIHLNPRFDQRAVMASLHRESDREPMESWFRMKFYDDLSDIRPERDGYYKHYIHYFVSQYFTQERVAGKKILDFGCGPGFYSTILSQRGASVVGIDLSPFLIAKANGHKVRLHLDNIEFIQADFIKYATHMAPLQFDYVIAIDTFVSFDYSRSTHDHKRVKKAFGGIKRVLKDNGRCFVIESHPFFGRVFQEIPSNTGESLCVRSPHYKIDYKLKSDVHHWFTLDEMTRATSENGLAVYRIFEPDPSPALKNKNPGGYAMHLKYPGMIVYEICKIH